MLLKNIPGLLPTLKDSVILESKLWNKNVEFIHPAQLIAFRTKTLFNDPQSNIDQDIDFLVKQVQFAELDDLCKSPLCDYFRPEDRAITTTEFINGLKLLAPECRLAMIFGLEMNLSASLTCRLTVQQAHDLEGLTEIAQSVLRNCILSAKTIHMFWQSTDDNEHVPLDLNEATLAAFGISWNSLLRKYKFMIVDHYNPLIMSC